MPLSTVKLSHLSSWSSTRFTKMTSMFAYEVTDLFYTNLRQHVESIISQRSDIYFDEQVWERVENIYTYYKDRDVLVSRFYYNVPVE